jgi:hypothetical protein
MAASVPKRAGQSKPNWTLSVVSVDHHTVVVDAFVCIEDALEVHENAVKSSTLAVQILMVFGHSECRTGSTRRISRSASAPGRYHAPMHRSALAPDDAALLRRVEKLIDTTDQPPSIGDIAKSLGIALRTVEAFIAKMTKIGILVRVGDNRVLLPRQIDAQPRPALTRPRTQSSHRQP